MKMKLFKKLSSFCLCIMLIMAIACITTGCSDDKHETPKTPGVQSNAPTVLGEGESTFMFYVIDKEGNETAFEIHTDKTIVGEALQELDLLEGDEGDFGLYVKKVNGISADYDTDGVYWAFYINDEYAITGVDKTEIAEDDIYMFKVEK